RNFYQSRWIVRSKQETASCFQRQRIDETACTPVVRSDKTLKLFWFFRVWPGRCVTDYVTREAVITPVYNVCLVPVLGRQKLEVEASRAFELFGKRFIKEDCDLHAFTLRCHDHA